MPARTPPWKRKKPATKKPAKKLTEAQKKKARARAKKAGRRYPNMVDNMAVAREAKNK